VTHRVRGVGGMEQMLSNLITRLLDRGHEVTVIARHCELPRHPRLRWVRVPGPARPFVIAYPLFFLIGSLVVMRNRRGLLHTTGALVANRSDLSTVHLCHRALQERTHLRRASRGSLPYRLNAWGAAKLSRRAEGWCYRRSRTRHLVAVSRGVAAELERYFPRMAGAVSVIPNGVDRQTYAPSRDAREAMRRKLGIREDALVAVFVGGEWEGKGLKFAIEGVAAADSWQLVVVGRGDEARYRRIAESCAPGRVHFAGEQRDTTHYYAGADAFVLPSVYEAFSLAAFEAAATGLPLLVTRVSGVEDVLVDGSNGWFIERDGALIAGRLRRLESVRVRTELGASARAATERFEWDHAVDAYALLYEALAEGWSA
jgi:glycosyltransferase involved in cell wall biosynthesis